MLNIDLKTWQVTAYNKYDFGDGLWSEEWELTSGREKIWLEKHEDDEVEWTVSKKLPIRRNCGRCAPARLKISMIRRGKFP
ncbi:MAG: DUF4178 domain-containing protein [Calditrichia bacterium]